MIYWDAADLRLPRQLDLLSSGTINLPTSALFSHVFMTKDVFVAEVEKNQLTNKLLACSIYHVSALILKGAKCCSPRGQSQRYCLMLPAAR